MTDKIYEKQLEEFGIDEIVAPTKADTKRSYKDDEARAMVAVVRNILNTPEGRQWIYNKLEVCGTFAAPLVPKDSHGSHVLIGMQSVGQMILNETMNASPEAFLLMSQEAAGRKLNGLA